MKHSRFLDKQAHGVFIITTTSFTQDGSIDFDSVDSLIEFYLEKGTNLSGIKRWMYQRGIRHFINFNVVNVRNLKVLEVENAQS